MTGEVNHVRNRHLVEDLGGAMRSGKHGLSMVPGLLKRVLAEESWREFTTQRNELVQHDRFVDFVTTPPLKGIGSTVELVRSICRDNVEALDLLEQALAREHGGPRSKVHNMNLETEGATPRGTSKAYALRRLRKDAPELHADVLAGQLSAHAAMVKAGFAPPTFSVRADSATSVAAALKRRLPADMLSELVEQLTTSEPSPP